MSEPMSDETLARVEARLRAAALMYSKGDVVEARSLLFLFAAYVSGMRAGLDGEPLLPKALSSSPVVAPGQWMCGLCGLINAYVQEHCERCKRRRQLPQPTPEGSDPADPEDDVTVRAALSAFTEVYARNPGRGEQLDMDAMRAAIRAINKLRGTP